MTVPPIHHMLNPARWRDKNELSNEKKQTVDGYLMRFQWGILH